MTLKLATHEDIPDILILAQAFVEESPYTGDAEDIEQTVRNLLRDRNQGIIVLYLVDDKPVGFIGGVLSKMITSKDPIATEVMWYVSPSARGSRKSLALKEAFEYWAKRVGAKMIAMSTLADDKIERYYERTGYKLMEKTYLKVIGV